MKEIQLTHQAVTMREPKVRDLMIMDKVQGEAKKEVILLSSLCQLTEDEILDLSMSDYSKLQKELQSFLA